MAYTRILVNVANPVSRNRVRIAARLAQAQGARLLGRHFTFDAQPRDTQAAFAPTSQVFAARESPVAPGDVTQEPPPEGEAERVRRDFEAVTQELGVAAAFEARSGGDRPLWACLAGEARCADLTVIGKPSGAAEETGIVNRLVEEAGGPVMVLPESASETPGRGHVVVGWNDSREAARAVRDALPLIRSAGRVSIVTVKHRSERGGSAERLKAYLEDHGAQVEIRRESGELRAADALISRAEHAGADLIVAGAFGRARVREMIAGGGTTGRLVQNTTLPLLMAQ